jgi:hypothetical protein
MSFNNNQQFDSQGRPIQSTVVQTTETEVQQKQMPMQSSGIMHSHGSSNTFSSTSSNLLGQNQYGGVQSAQTMKKQEISASSQPVSLMSTAAPIGASNYYIGQDYYNPQLGLKGFFLFLIFFFCKC